MLEDSGRLSQLSPFTIRQLTTGYGRYLTWLDSRGLHDEGECLAERITPVRVRDYVAALGRDNATSTIIHRTTGLALAGKAMNPQMNWSWIDRITTSVRVRHEPAKPKRHRLVGSGVLLDLGLEMMTRAPSVRAGRRRLITYRDGLLIALLAARPLRIRNLAGLALDCTVVLRDAAWWIEIPGIETKTRDPIEAP
jgi:integrase/recombinase XerD